MPRAISPELDAILDDEFKVLDHGFVRVIDYMGNDSSVPQAARVSYGNGTKSVSDDKSLINYLMRMKHSTPFEMCEIKLHVKLPIFIARQWIRTRTANVNESSARYSIMSKEIYIPSYDQLKTQSKTNKQGKSSDVLNLAEAEYVLKLLKEDAEKCYSDYEYMLNEDQNGNIIDENRQGLARELARINLTLNHYTEWYWKIDLHNLMNFLEQRLDSHAQYEIRVYAQVIADMVKVWCPIVWAAFEEYRLGAVTFSRKEMKQILSMLDVAHNEGAQPFITDKFTKGEFEQFLGKIS